MIGSILSNRYEIVEKIGDGGMALVYSAKDTLLNRLVAVKILREQYANDSEFIDRFYREAQAAASLSHPNVVTVYDVGTVEKTPFIVMEYVHGQNLSEIIKEQGQLNPADVVKVSIQICSALAHAHRHNIVHRDIKPHNILITKDGQVKVTDFGIAAISSMSITQTGVVLGSVLYFSPEQARGNKVDHLSDLYSLGVVMYEMLCGRVPFRAETPISIALKHIQDQPVPPTRVNPRVPPQLEKIVLKLLAKRPEERFQSALELSTALEKVDLGAAVDADVEQTQKLTIDVSERLDEQKLEEGEAELSAVSRKKPGKRSKKARSRAPIVLLLLLLFAGLVFGLMVFIPELLFPDDVPVPNVVGLSVEEAERILAESKLKMAVEIEVFDNEVPEGHVISQEPKAYRMKKENQAVFVRVSKGPEFVYMPSVIGLSHREAQLALTQAGFTLGEAKFVQTGEHPVNTVVDQEPQPDEYVALGSPVVLMVSQGLDTIPVVVLPNFRGQELDAVRQQLAELGLKEGKLIPEFSTMIPKDHVVEQNPPPFAEVEVGWEVDLVYSEGSPASGRSDAEGVQRWTTNGDWHFKQVRIDVPEGRDQEIAIIVVDDFGAREVYRQVHAGGSSFDFTAQGRGDQARIQVYIGGRLFIDRDFVE